MAKIEGPYELVLLWLCGVNKQWHSEVKLSLDWLVVKLIRLDIIRYFQNALRDGLSMKLVHQDFCDNLLAYE